MRLIGHVASEKAAFTVYSYLLKENIHSTYEREGEVFALWVYEEDEAFRAKALLDEYNENPADPRYAKIEFPKVPPQPPDLIAEAKKEAAQKDEEEIARMDQPLPISRKRRSHPFTIAVVLLCVILYIFNGVQRKMVEKNDGRLGLQFAMTPIERTMMFDYPKSNQVLNTLIQKYALTTAKEINALPSPEKEEFIAAQNIPTWRGYLIQMVNWVQKKPTPLADKGPFMEQIRQGQVWRLFTPALLHAGFLHILFNMAWAWLLLKQIEERLDLWKLVILIVLIGTVANIAQYIVSGPTFLGFSGVVCGLVGFIWVRQRIAPWEGYPLPKSIFIFLVVFVLAMFALELISVLVAIFSKKVLSANIANTAHIIGGLFGALMGRIPFFGRGAK